MNIIPVGLTAVWEWVKIQELGEREAEEQKPAKRDFFWGQDERRNIETAHGHGHGEEDV